jgi:glyoxylate reductase
MARIVILGRIPQPAIDRLRAEHDVQSWDEDSTPSREQVLERVAGADAILSLLTSRVDGEVLDAAGPQLRLVANVAVGYDNIDVPACTQRGVVATNTPDVLTEATADIAIALTLMVTRRLGEGERLIRAGTPWRWGMFFMLGSGIQDQQFGVVGMGKIGQATAERARAFGMSIAYTKRTPLEPAVAERLGARHMDLDELLATSHVVSLHCPYGPETHHLIDAARLRSMRRDAYLINTARGPVVDESALVDALRDGTIAGAGLDVFENEPEVHPGLLTCENAVLLPHLGSATIETRGAMADLAAANALAVLAGEPPLTPVG